MKLLLTSDGVYTRKMTIVFQELLGKPAATARVLVMSCPESKEAFKYIESVERELERIGIKYIRVVNISEDISAQDFSIDDIDVFYSCGGNTFSILDRVRKTGFDKFIKEFIHQDK